jgi:serine phosphatase RsbU (regulator of sigma subunit)
MKSVSDLCVKVFLILLFSMGLQAQDPKKIDSIKKRLNISQSDTALIRLNLNLGDQYEYIVPDSALYFYEQALSLSEKAGVKKFIAKCHSSIGNIHFNREAFDIALVYYQKSLNLNQELGDKNEIAACYGNMGLIYYSYSVLDKAIDNFQKALQLFEELGNKKKMISCYSFISVIHMNLGAYDQSIDYSLKALRIADEMNDKMGISRIYIVIGNLYGIKKEYDKAIEYYEKSNKFLEELGGGVGLGLNYCNIGIVSENQGKFKTALEYYLKALVIFEEFNDKTEISRVYANMSSLFTKMGEYGNAIKFAEKSLEISKENGFIDNQRHIYLNLSGIYDSLGNYKKAYEYYKLFKKTNDSIFNENSSKQIKQMEARYQNEKKQQQILLLNKDNELQKTEISRQKTVKNYLFGLTALILLIVIIVIWAYFQKQKTNRQLQLLNKEIIEQKELIEVKNQNLSEANRIIEHKNKNITDSIRYAKRIQSAIFPPQELINKLIPDSFIVYKPKSIVSGDFYWLDQKDDHVYFATVDCTGHGVPGAFMSIVGYNILNQALNEKQITDPGEILNFLSRSIALTLRQNESDISLRDGMDLVVCRLNRITLLMEYAGAHNSLCLVRNDELLEYKTEKFQIGQAFSEKFKGYTSQKLELMKDDMLYLFSDGFMDQYNSTNDRKYTSKKFKELLTAISAEATAAQYEKLNRHFEEWKGKNDQTDDVTVFGLKI